MAGYSGTVADSPVILILTGSPGSGKTSVARSLTRTWRKSVHLESDQFFHFIESGYIEPWRAASHGQNQVVMRIVAMAAAGYARAGYETVIDGIVLPAWFFEPLRDALQREGFVVAYAVLRPPLDVAQERARLRSDSFFDSDVIEKIWNGFTDLGTLEPHAIDSRDQTPEQTATVIDDRLKAGSLLV
jgi:tRNA uridine 5-carbamoylmethylation protein Kti12